MKKSKVPIHRTKTREFRFRGIDIITLGQNKANGYDSSQHHRHDFFEIFLFCETEGVHELDFEEIPIERNSLHFVTPGHIHRLKGYQSQGYVVCFKEELLRLPGKKTIGDRYRFLDDFAVPAVKLSEKEFRELYVYVKVLCRELKNLSGEEFDAFTHYLSILLIKVQARLPVKFLAVHDNRKRSITYEFRKKVSQHHREHLTVREYAAKLCVSPNYLNALCKANEGKSAISIIHERNLLEAKRLLASTDLSVKEISYLLNFEDVAYFNRFFKKHSLQTPGQYRQLLGAMPGH